MSSNRLYEEASKIILHHMSFPVECGAPKHEMKQCPRLALGLTCKGCGYNTSINNQGKRST